MNPMARKLFLGNPLSRPIYFAARRFYRGRRMARGADRYFVNADDYRTALKVDDGRFVEIQTKDGLTITVRRNCVDAAILTEIFLDNCYVRGLSLPDQPVVVDIGGYIGDFALYAAKHLNARRIIVCEPSPRNWALLTRNISQNGYSDRIQALHKAVTDGRDVMMNVDVRDRGQHRVSAYYVSDQPLKNVPGITLAAVIRDYAPGVVDLLKIDCEGAEYTIFETTPSEVLSQIRNIVFEYHEIDGFRERLAAVKEKLRGQGYSLKTSGTLISAVRGRS